MEYDGNNKGNDSTLLIKFYAQMAWHTNEFSIISFVK